MLACSSATGATVAERSSSARQKPPKSVLGATRLASAGWPLSTASAQDGEEAVELRAAAGEGVAEAGQVCAGSRSGSSRRTCRRTGRCRPVRGGRPRAGSFRRPRSPCEESPGTICRYLRPSGDLGRMIIVELTGSGSTFLSRLRLSSAATSPSAHLHRHDRLDDADPGAADPHLVALDQGVGVGNAGLEVVGGDEGQAVVGVVGEEDGDDDDQHGHRPDDHRAARHPLYAAAVSHGPRR